MDGAALALPLIDALDDDALDALATLPPRLTGPLSACFPREDRGA